MHFYCCEDRFSRFCMRGWGDRLRWYENLPVLIWLWNEIFWPVLIWFFRCAHFFEVASRASHFDMVRPYPDGTIISEPYQNSPIAYRGMNCVDMALIWTIPKRETISGWYMPNLQISLHSFVRRKRVWLITGIHDWLKPFVITNILERTTGLF